MRAPKSNKGLEEDFGFDLKGENWKSGRSNQSSLVSSSKSPTKRSYRKTHLFIALNSERRAREPSRQC